jgi:hypothetical protein
MSLFDLPSAEISKQGHFIYFYNDKSKRFAEWDLMRYLSVKSFHVENPDYQINFYTNAEPCGDYWERAKSFVTVHQVEPPTEVFGNPLIHPAHASDIFRIRKLKEVGGVYCDFDTITVGSFDRMLQEQKFVIARLASKSKTYGNGVLVCPPNAKYLEEWYAEYTWFRSKGKDDYWDEHSVKLHHTLTARESLAGEFKVLDYETFYPYRYTQIEKLYDEYVPELITPQTVSVHLYDSAHFKKIQAWPEERIKAEPHGCSYAWIASKYLND